MTTIGHNSDESLDRFNPFHVTDNKCQYVLRLVLNLMKWNSILIS